MADFEEALKDTIQVGQRKQDAVNPQKYRYSEAFDNLAEYNTHIVAIVLYRFREQAGEIIPNNYSVTAYQKETGAKTPGSLLSRWAASSRSQGSGKRAIKKH